MSAFLRGFPLLALPILAYNWIAFMQPVPWHSAIFTQAMVSGQIWIFSLSDMLVSVALLLLFVEVLKATRTGAVSIVDHLLSTLLFIASLIEFLLVAQAANSTFFLLMLICFIDVIAGYSVTIAAARRDFGIERSPPPL